MRRPPPPHAVIHLPALAPEEALRFMDLLGRVIDGIWRAHGPAIEAWRAAQPTPPRRRPASPPPSDDDAIF
jgi:hypothetical protein